MVKRFEAAADRFEAALLEAGWGWTTSRKYAQAVKVFVYWMATGRIPEKRKAGLIDPATVVAP